MTVVVTKDLKEHNRNETVVILASGVLHSEGVGASWINNGMKRSSLIEITHTAPKACKTITYQVCAPIAACSGTLGSKEPTDLRKVITCYCHAGGEARVLCLWLGCQCHKASWDLPPV